MHISSTNKIKGLDASGKLVTVREGDRVKYTRFGLEVIETVKGTCLDRVPGEDRTVTRPIVILSLVGFMPLSDVEKVAA